MQLCQTLEAYGYALTLKDIGGLSVVEARRTPAAAISAKAAAPLLLQLSRAQDEAIRYLRERERPSQIVASPLIDAWILPADCTPEHLHEHEAAILSGGLTPDEEAIAIAKFNLCLGRVTTSDDRLWVEVLQEYMS